MVHNLGALGENVTFDFSVSALKAGICKKLSKLAKIINFSMKLKQKVASCGSRMQKIGGLWVRAIEEPTFHQKLWGLWVTAETISKNMGSLGDSSAENRESLEPYIRITSIMGVPPPPRQHSFISKVNW